MTKQEFYAALENVLESHPGTIKGDEALASLAGWDSLASMAFMAMADEKFGQSVSGAALLKCNTVSDLVNLMGSHIQG